MDDGPQTTRCPELAAARDRWLRNATERLESIPTIAGVALTGSLGRGTADDWSDVDLFVIANGQPTSAIPIETLTTLGDMTMRADSSHNTRADAHAFAAGFVVDGVIVHTDWYVFPNTAEWPCDALPVVRGDRITVSTQGFDEMNGEGPRGASPERGEADFRRSRFILVPLAAKHLARGYLDEATALIGVITESRFSGQRIEGLAVLRQFIQDLRDDVDEATFDATSAVLDLAEAAIGRS